MEIGFPTDEDQRDRRTPSRRPMEFPVEDWYKDQSTLALQEECGFSRAVHCPTGVPCVVRTVR